MTTRKVDEMSMGDPAVASCPFGFYHAMLEQDPVHLDPAHGFYWVTKRKDVIAAAQDWQHFISDHGLQQRRDYGPRARQMMREAGVEVVGTLVQSDPPRHDEYRRVGITAFTPQRVDELLPHIESIIRELIDGIIGEREIDFVSRFAALLPATVVCDEYGFPREDRARFKYWTDGIILIQTPGLTEEEEVGYTERLIQCFRYLEEYILKAAAEPSGRVIYNIATMNKKDGTPFTMLERMWMAIAVFVGGNETTVNMLASGVYRLAKDPVLQRELRANPELIPNFVEELLRLDGSVQVLVREAGSDVEFGGKRIPAGAPVMLCTGAANRDPDYWPEPDAFRLDRANARTHLTFGSGKHVCVGAHVARVELRLAFRMLLERLDNIRLQDPDMAWPYLPLPYFHAMASLPIAFDPIR